MIIQFQVIIGVGGVKAGAEEKLYINGSRAISLPAGLDFESKYRDGVYISFSQ